MHRKSFLSFAVLLCFCLPLFSAEKLLVTEVTEREDIQTRTYPGKVVVMAQVNIVARVEGEILKVGFQNGQYVKRGDVLFSLEQTKYQAAVKNAEAKVAEYKARIEYASGNYDRNLRLSDVNAVSKDALESSLSVRNAYQAALDAAEATVASANVDLQNCTIDAPIDGKLGTTNFTLGNYVTPTSGTLVTLVQTSPIRVRFAISSRDFLSMFDGSSKAICAKGRADVILANGKKLAEKGFIEYVENVANDNTDTIYVYAQFPNAENILNPGNTVEVVIGNVSGALRPAVPLTAILQDARGSYVWVVKADNTAEKRYILRGSLQTDFQLVTSGLAKGERIVADGAHKVRAGMEIEPVTVKSAAAEGKR